MYKQTKLELRTFKFLLIFLISTTIFAYVRCTSSESGEVLSRDRLSNTSCFIFLPEVFMTNWRDSARNLTELTIWAKWIYKGNIWLQLNTWYLDIFNWSKVPTETIRLDKTFIVSSGWKLGLEVLPTICKVIMLIMSLMNHQFLLVITDSSVRNPKIKKIAGKKPKIKMMEKDF